MMEFRKNDFQVYRALKDIRLGNPERTIVRDQELEFDGHTLIIDGESMALPAFRGAVLNGWVALAEDEEAEYVPKPADIKVGPADNAGATRDGRMRIQTVVEDEQFVGTVDERRQAREENNERIRQKDQARAQRRPRARREAPPEKRPSRFPVAEAHEQESVTVGTIESRANHRSTIKDTSSADREINRLSSTQGSSPPKVKRAGDVEEAQVGEELTEILPEAVSTEKPKPGPAPKAESDFQWDMSRHWKTRVSEAVELARTNKPAFNKVMAMESPKLKKHIRKALTSE